MSPTYNQQLPNVISAIVFLKDARGSTEMEIHTVIKDRFHQAVEEAELKKTLKHGVDVHAIKCEKQRYKLANCYEALASVYGRRRPDEKKDFKRVSKPGEHDNDKPRERDPMTQGRRDFLNASGRKYEEDSLTIEDSDDEYTSDEDDHTSI